MAKNIRIFGPMRGTLIPLSECPDPVFASGAMGRGVAIKNPKGAVFSPFDCEVTVVFPTCHAIGLKSNDGIELFIHVGIDTVKMNGEGFKAYVEGGDKVKQGQLLLKFSPEAVKKAGYDTTTAVVVTNPADFGDITFELEGQTITSKAQGDGTSSSRADNSTEDNAMEGRKFTILGETGSGKTCYLLGMYFEMSMSVAGYTVIATNPDDDKNLTLRYEMLNDKSRGQNRFPAGTDDVQKINFNLQYAYETILPFQWVDYPGGFLDPTRRDVSSEQYQEVEKSINESDMLFICIDGANLVGNGTRNKIRKVKSKCAKNINPYLGNLKDKLKKEGATLPPIGMVVTKYDLCDEYTDPQEVKEIIEAAFEPLFEDDETFVAIIPVSLGATLQDDSYQGELEPMNIHIPILMGINFALIDMLHYGKYLIEEDRKNVREAEQLKREEEDRFFLSRWLFGGYDTDKIAEYISDTKEQIEQNRQVAQYFKKSLYRVNRELDVINMIFANGSWQDRRGIHKIWDDLQKIVEYF